MKKALPLILLSAIFLVGCGTYSEGARVGIVTKISEKGYFQKSWEGKMNVGAGGGNFSPEIWEFSVEDPEALEELMRVQETGERVKLDYKQEIIIWPFRANTRTFIKSVSATGE